jgi:hypothetical protein
MRAVINSCNKIRVWMNLRPQLFEKYYLPVYKNWGMEQNDEDSPKRFRKYMKLLIGLVQE